MSMRSLSLLGVLSLALAVLGGCPTPPDAQGPGGAAAQGGGPGAPGGGAGGPSAGGGPGGQGGGPGAGQGGPGGGGPEGGQRPSFGDVMKDGDPTITITVSVAGAGDGQVDFQTIKTEGDRSYPQVVHVETLDADGNASITAPSTYASPLYVSAVRQLDSFPKKEDLGTAPEAITLAGEDISVSIEIGSIADWMNPFMAETGTPPPDGGAGGPGGGSGGPGGGGPGSGGPGGPGGPPPEGGAGGEPPPSQ